MSRILIIEDEAAAAKGFKSMLEFEGFEVMTAKDSKQGMKIYKNFIPDLVLLDVYLGSETGYAICEKLRETEPTLPIVFLTNSNTELNQVRGFSVGADDYIIKVEASERPQLFAAKLKAAINRVRRMGAKSPESIDEFMVDNVRVNVVAKTVIGPGINETLTGTEADILDILHASSNKVVLYSDLMKRLRGSALVDSDMLHVHISHLRKKLGERASRKLMAIKSRGYLLCK